MQVSIEFVPTKKGVGTDTLVIQSDDPSHPSRAIKLVGMGTAK